jgi:hypothetical protein
LASGLCAQLVAGYNKVYASMRCDIAGHKIASGLVNVDEPVVVGMAD